MTFNTELFNRTFESIDSLNSNIKINILSEGITWGILFTLIFTILAITWIFLGLILIYNIRKKNILNIIILILLIRLLDITQQNMSKWLYESLYDTVANL